MARCVPHFMKVMNGIDSKAELKRHLAHRPELDGCLEKIREATEVLSDCFANSRRVYLAGNGGSAADAEHWAGELLKGFYRSRPLSSGDLAGFSTDLGQKLQGGLPAIPLTSFPILRTAVLNDQGPDMDFAQLLWALGCHGDVFVAISTSGNAKNLLLAAEAAKARGLRIIALTGAGGGLLKPVADVWIGVPEQKTHMIQELHLAVYHAISLLLEDQHFQEPST